MRYLHPKRIIRKAKQTFVSFFLYYLIPDKWYLKAKYKSTFHESLDLRNPRTFNAKIQWMKLYDRAPLYHELVDKFQAKEWVKKIVGEKYIIPTLGIWDSVSDIDWDSLPSQFVIKCTHDAASWSICLNKNSFDYSKAISRLSEAIKKDYYHSENKQWVYKGIKRRIIAEPLIKDNPDIEVGLTDYKFFCFNGVADCVMIGIDREKNDAKFYFFDREWKLLKYNRRSLSLPDDFYIAKPHNIAEMFKIAETLSAGFSFVRVDLYNSNGKILFGEMTFNPDGGMDTNLLPFADEYLGSLIDVPKIVL